MNTEIFEKFKADEAAMNEARERFRNTAIETIKVILCEHGDLYSSFLGSERYGDTVLVDGNEVRAICYNNGDITVEIEMEDFDDTTGEFGWMLRKKHLSKMSTGDICDIAEQLLSHPLIIQYP